MDDCPRDLKAGEKIIVTDKTFGETECTVIGYVDGMLSVSLADYMGAMLFVDPNHSTWRRQGPPPAKYGVFCADKHCPVGFYPDAEIVPNWTCRSCRNR